MTVHGKLQELLDRLMCDPTLHLELCKGSHDGILSDMTYSSESEDWSTHFSRSNMDGNSSETFDNGTYSICVNESLFYTALCHKSNFYEHHLRANASAEMVENNRIVEILVPILFGIAVVVGLFGNALVVIVVAANQQMRNTTNLLIINLAIADLLFIVFCVPFTATAYVLPSWPFGDTWCKIVQYLIIATAYISVYTLVLMSLDRYLAVVHPISSMSVRTESNTYVAITVLWSVIIVVCVPVALVHGETIFYVSSMEGRPFCSFLPNYGNHAAFQLSFFMTSYVLPLLIIVGLYCRMITRLWQGVKAGGKISAESLRGKRRVTRMVVIVVIIFAVCWCPIQIQLVLQSLKMYESSNSAVVLFLQIISQTLAYMNSCVNPILYAFLSDNFRKAFRKVIKCGSLFPPASDVRLNDRSEGKQMARSPMLPHPQNPTMTTANETVINGEKARALATDEAEDAV